MSLLSSHRRHGKPIHGPMCGYRLHCCLVLATQETGRLLSSATCANDLSSRKKGRSTQTYSKWLDLSDGGLHSLQYTTCVVVCHLPNGWILQMEFCDLPEGTWDARTQFLDDVDDRIYIIADSCVLEDCRRGKFGFFEKRMWWSILLFLSNLSGSIRLLMKPFLRRIIESPGLHPVQSTA